MSRALLQPATVEQRAEGLLTVLEHLARVRVRARVRIRVRVRVRVRVRILTTPP